MGIAVIGLGRIGKVHAEIYRYRVEGARLVAVVDIKEDLARMMGEKLGVKWYVDYEKALKDPEVDAVVICTPSYIHAEMIVRAAEEGKRETLITSTIDGKPLQCLRVPGPTFRTIWAAIFTGGGHFGLAVGWLSGGAPAGFDYTSGQPVVVTVVHLGLFLAIGLVSGGLARSLARRGHEVVVLATSRTRRWGFEITPDAQPGVNPKPRPGQGKFMVTLKFNSEGANAFYKITAEKASYTSGDVKNRLAIVLDDRVIIAPGVDEPDAVHLADEGPVGVPADDQVGLRHPR